MRESNSHDHFWSQDFKSGVSTYSTIRATSSYFDGANLAFYFILTKLFTTIARFLRHTTPRQHPFVGDFSFVVEIFLLLKSFLLSLRGHCY